MYSDWIQENTGQRWFRIWALFKQCICGNCEFPQSFHTMKLGQTSVLYAGFLNSNILFKVISKWFDLHFFAQNFIFLFLWMIMWSIKLFSKYTFEDFEKRLHILQDLNFTDEKMALTFSFKMLKNGREHARFLKFRHFLTIWMKELITNNNINLSRTVITIRSSRPGQKQRLEQIWLTKLNFFAKKLHC